jgi:hypothetical protein
MGRFEAIAKILGITAEDAAKMSPDLLRSKLLQSGTETIKDSKAMGNTVHVLKDNTEQAIAKNIAEGKSPWGSVQMRAAGAVPTVSMGLEDQLKTLQQEVAQPLSSRWEQLKGSVYGPLSKQLNLTKDPEQAKQIESALSMVADPINLIPGGAGLGAAGLQALGAEEKKK